LNQLVLAPTTVPNAAPLDYLDAAIAAGWDAVGLRLHRSPNLPYHPVLGDAQLIREMQSRLADARMPVHDIFTFYLQAANDFEAFARSLELGAAFGARYALVQGDDPDWTRLADTYARFCDLAASFGITVVIEFNPARPLATLQQASRTIAAAGRTNAAICVDPLHLARSGSVPSDLHGIDAGLLPYVQFSDGKLNPLERLLPGEGSLPLREFLAALPAGTPLSVEVPIPHRSHATTADWVNLVLDRTRTYLAT
jgi:sugar phosphate isomerase/epimerase